MMAKPTKRMPGRPGALEDGVARPAAFTFRLSPFELEYLKRQAQRARMPVGAFIIEALQERGALPKRQKRTRSP